MVAAVTFLRLCACARNSLLIPNVASPAFSLHQKGADVLLTEARDVVGGNVITREEDGFIWEEGPNTFQPTRQIMRLAVDLGLKDELVFADHELPRCVYWEGEFGV